MTSPILSAILHLLVLGAVPADDYPFRNISLPWADRAYSRRSHVPIGQGRGWKFGGPAPPIKRLGIGPYSWNTECLRGDADAGNATSYPQAIGLAASFSTALIYRVGEATSVEVHAKYNDYVKKGQYGDHKGLSCFSPVINVLRDPRWGRNQVLTAKPGLGVREWLASVKCTSMDTCRIASTDKRVPS